MIKRYLIRLGSCAALALLAGFDASASMMYTGRGTGGNSALNARVQFDLTGSTLTATLSNISMSDVMVPTDVLTGVFFNLAGNTALTPMSAVLGSGSSVLFAPSTDANGNRISGGTYAGGDVGAEWAYANGLVGPHGANEGISSSGLGLFGPSNRFDTLRDLSSPADVDGLQYGITSKGDNAATGNQAVTGSEPLIDYSVMFSFNVGNSFNLSNITGVSFQYGTALNEPNITGSLDPGLSPVPEPATIVLLTAGLGMLALFRTGSLWRKTMSLYQA